MREAHSSFLNLFDTALGTANLPRRSMRDAYSSFLSLVGAAIGTANLPRRSMSPAHSSLLSLFGTAIGTASLSLWLELGELRFFLCLTRIIGLLSFRL